jgi:tetratricopeptide (TPR) repeat protein
MAWCRFEQGRLSEAEAAAGDALGIYQNRGVTGSPVFNAYAVLQNVLSSSWRFEEAHKVTDEALALAQSSGGEHPGIADILHNQARIYLDQSRFPEAEKAASQAVRLHRRLREPGHPETAWGLYTLGTALQKQQKLADAEDAFREALGIFRQRYRGDHRSLTSTLGNLKEVLRAQGDQTALEALNSEEAKSSENPGDDLRVAGLLLKNNPTADQKEEARRLIRRATEGFAKVAVDHPDDLDRRVNAAFGFVELFKICAVTPDFAKEVEEVNRRLEAELTQLAASFPESNDCQWWISCISRAWGYELMDYTAFLPMAERHLREAGALLEKHFPSDPKRPDAWWHLANNYVNLGEAQWKLSKLQEAEAAFRRAVNLFDEHAAEISADPLPVVAVEAASDYIRAALFFIAINKHEEATELVRKAAEKTKYARHPVESVSLLFSLAIEQLLLGDHASYRATCQALAEVPVNTLDDLAKARVILSWCLAPDALEDPGLAVKRAEEFAANNSLGQPHVIPFCLGATLYRAGQYEQATELLEKSIAVYPVHPQPGYHVINYQRLFLAMAKWRQGNSDEARQWLGKSRPRADEKDQTLSSFPHIQSIDDLFRREAEAMIEPKEVDEAVEQVNDE